MAAVGNLKSAPQTGDAIVSGAPSAAPVCLIVDEDLKIRHFLSLILHGAGVDAVEYSSGHVLRAEQQPRQPELVFVNVGVDTGDALQTLQTLSTSRYAGAVQLMSNHGIVVLENLKRIGEQSKLRMLPVLRKPFEADAITKILHAEKLGDGPAVSARVRLDEALKQGWIETWYQPKINLRKKQLAGVEAFARVRHPEHGVLPPSAFMPGADEPTLLALSEQTLISALKSGLNLSKLGINLRIAINMSLDAVDAVPVAEVVRSYRPQANAWAGLIIDITEEQIVTNIERASAVARQLETCNVKLAIDDFGRGVSSLMKVQDVPFAEMKLDRIFVTNCSTDEVNASICKTVIDMAHSFGGLAVGIGVEKPADVGALIDMGCDLGQGYLLGQPMAEERFFALLRQRVASRAAAAAGSARQKS